MAVRAIAVAARMWSDSVSPSTDEINAGETDSDLYGWRTVAARERWALLSRHRDRVVASICARGITPHDAEDCVHDALVQLAAYPALDHDRVGALLIVVAMRRAYDRQRVRGREQRNLRRIGGFADGVVSPADIAMDRVEAHRLGHTVRRLPRRQRDVLMYRAAGLSVVEAALRLGISTKAAESALGRARARLRPGASEAE